MSTPNAYDSPGASADSIAESTIVDLEVYFARKTAPETLPRIASGPDGPLRTPLFAQSRDDLLLKWMVDVSAVVQIICEWDHPEVSAYTSLLNDMKANRTHLTPRPTTVCQRYCPLRGSGLETPAQRHQNLIMDTIISFGLELEVLSVSDNEEATVQGLKALKRSTRIRPLVYCAYKEASVEKVFQECSRQLTLPRRPGQELTEIGSAYSEESMVTHTDDEDNLVVDRLCAILRSFYVEIGHRNSMEFNLRHADDFIANASAVRISLQKDHPRSLE
ncbi:hypothetical protein V1504DRAFT_472233 [Lipomyces starkeyi]